MEGFDWVFFKGLHFRESLTIVEVDEISGSVVLTSLSAFRAVSGKVSYFSALEASVRLISRGGRVALEVRLWAVSLIAIGILLSAEVVASVISSIVSSSWGSVSIYVHGDGGVIHPSRGI